MEDVAGRFPLQPQRLPRIEQSCPHDGTDGDGQWQKGGSVPLALTAVDRVGMAADPFADLLHPAVKLAVGIEAPVDEHSEAGVQPPAGPFLGGGQEGEHRK